MRASRVLVSILLYCCVVSAADAAVTASGGWSRQTVPGSVIGVGYVTLHNDGSLPRKLLRVSSPVAERVEPHETTVGSDGVARMRPLAGLVIQPGETIRFAPGGKHFMLLGLKEPLQAGAVVRLQLEFENEAPITIALAVEAMPLSINPAGHDHSQH